MAVDPENDFYLLHSAIEEESEGEIQLLKEKYESILGSVEVERKRGECKGRWPRKVFRGCEGRGHAKFSWGLRPRPPYSFVNRPESEARSAPVLIIKKMILRKCFFTTNKNAGEFSKFAIPGVLLEITLKFSSSFFPRTARLWNSLPSNCFPSDYDLQSFKSNINQYLSLSLQNLSFALQEATYLQK